MQGAPKRQVNAEEMLAELKRALESSTRAPDVRRPPPRGAQVRFSGPESSRSQIDRGSDRPVWRTPAAGSDRGLTFKSRPAQFPTLEADSRRARACGIAAVCASFVFLNKAPNLAERQPSVAATEGLARPKTQQTLEPSSAPEAAAPPFTPGPLNQATALVAAHRIGPDGCANPGSAICSRSARFSPASG